MSDVKPQRARRTQNVGAFIAVIAVVLGMLLVGYGISSLSAAPEKEPPPGPPPDEAGMMPLDTPNADGPPHGHHGPMGPPPMMFDQEQVDLAIEVLDQVRPETAKWARDMAKEHPDEIGRELARRFPRIAMFLEMRERHPEMFELRLEDMRLNRESAELAETFKRARNQNDTENARQIKADLVVVVTEHFEIRQHIRELELAALERRIERLRDELAEREKMSQRIIDSRLRELIDDAPASW